MKNTAIILLFLLGQLTMAYAQSVKVACIGNSITYGAGIPDREKNSYPAQLQYLLGENYEVSNFGVSGCTLLSKGNSPYINTSQFKASLEYMPDIVVIKLGTNDTKNFNADKLVNFKTDYEQLIKRYQALPSTPRIILCTPVYCYLTEGVFAKANTYYDQQVNPAIASLAYENGLEIVDFYHLFSDKHSELFFPDKLHPSSIGAGEMSALLANVIALNTNSYQIDVPRDQPFNFYGYQGYNFSEGNKIVLPRRAAKGNPWVIRARFWGHEPQTDIALLQQGFHIAYCDVADLYGSPQAIKRYDRFYKEMTKKGLNKKVVLEAMSRGGLIAFNWAAKNQNKVAAIYADAPVLDIKSWPFKHGGEGDVNTLMKAYQFKDTTDLKAWKKNPIDQLKELSKIPILLVVGDIDNVVPIAENSTIMETNIRQMGGTIELIHKPNVGHHPHSLFAPASIVNFILTHTECYNNLAIKPIPNNEFRYASAGWGKNSWFAVAQEIDDILSNKEVDELFLGNSITQAWGGSRKLVGGIGKPAMDRYCTSWENAGISGDRTENLLYRLQNGSYGKANPKIVYITIGVNNLNHGDTPENSAAGIIAVVKEAEKVFPNAHIVLFGLLPVSLRPDDSMRKKHDKIHQILAEQKFGSRVDYQDIRSVFLLPNGDLNEKLYSGDMLHLGFAGYEAWAERINACRLKINSSSTLDKKN